MSWVSVNSLRLMPHFIDSDGLRSGCVWMLYAWYGVLLVRTVFVRVVCECFTPHTAFYVFGRCSFGLCVNGLRLVPHFMRLDDVFLDCVWMVYVSYRVLYVRTMFFRVICEWFTPDTADMTFYAFGRCSFGLCVNTLRPIWHFMRSDDVFFGLYVNDLRFIPRFMRLNSVLSRYVWMVYASYCVLCIRTVFFRVICEWFTPDTAFYAFGRCSFGLCVNGLRSIPCFPRSDTIFSGCVWMVYVYSGIFLIHMVLF